MVTFENGMDARCRAFSLPTVARFRIDNPNCVFHKGTAPEYRYCVIGTQYGYIHTSGGDVRTWKSYSGARRFARNYVPL